MADHKQRTGGRRFGYFVSIVLNLLFLYGMNNLLRWEVPFLNHRFTECLWAINLSLGVTIFMYATFMLFDRRWFKHFMQAITNVFSLASAFVFRRVFPLDVPPSSIYWINIGLLVVMGILILSTVIELGSAVKHYRREVAA